MTMSCAEQRNIGGVLKTLLVGYTSGPGTITSNDNILTALEKLSGNINSAVNGTLNLALTGFNSTTGVLSASDTILSALEKLNGNINALSVAVTGALVYQGTWNAATNTPTLISGAGTKGYYYKVSVAGTTAVNGISQWNIGDMVVFNGTTWDKIDGVATEVTSVAGRIGAVVLSQADIAGLTTSSSPTFANVTATTFTGILNGNANSLDSTKDYRMNSLGVGVAPSGLTGDIRATGDVTAFYSDLRLKTIVENIPNALSKVMQLNGFLYKNNNIAKSYGYTSDEVYVGVGAQQVQAVLPECVTAAPFDIGQNDDGTEYSKSGMNFLTVKYEKLVPLLIEAIKELKAEIDALKNNT